MPPWFPLFPLWGGQKIVLKLAGTCATFMLAPVYELFGNSIDRAFVHRP